MDKNDYLRKKVLNIKILDNSNSYRDKIYNQKINTNYKKILIYGFPHTGTTILRSILAHVKDIHEIVDECLYINTNFKTNNKYVLAKWVKYISENDFIKYYSDYQIIFILRNPLYVFSSINKRLSYDLNDNHSIKKYIKFANQFNNFQKYKNFHLIRYEDMFSNNFENLKNIFNKIGLNYNNDIFNNENYENKVQHNFNKFKIPDVKPNDTDHTRLRLYQINQPIKYDDNIKKLDLLDLQINEILKNEDINKIYPKLDVIIEEYKSIKN